MEINELVGKHVLTGVDRYNDKAKSQWSEYEDSEFISFLLDGVCYTAIEDPEDGYRSSMRELKIDGHQVKNIFPPCEVVGKMRDKDDYYENEIIDFISTANGKTILSIGTGACDDYYPYWVAEYTPENMPINEGE